MTPAEWAKRHAEAGIPVFPVRITPAGGDKTDKRPLTQNGHLDASTDPAQVETWWRKYPDAAIGGRLSDLDIAVIDVDVTDGAQGPETLTDLSADLGPLPDTVEVLTPSGGRHLWFKAHEVGSRNGWAPDVDVKGDGGWVVLPGSVSPLGTYEFEASSNPHDGIKVAHMPAAWLARMPGRNGSTTSAGSDDLDGLRDVDRQVMEVLERLGGHRPFTHRDRDTGLVEGRMTRPGKRAGNAVSVGHLGPGMVRIFSPNWVVPDGPAKGKTLPEGVYDLDQLEHFADTGELRDDLYWIDGTAAQADGSDHWRPESLADLAASPPEPVGFLLRRLWPSDAYGVIAAESKAGKTWIALDVAHGVATGHDALDSIAVDTVGPVVVFLGEGGRRNAWRRLRAICEHYGTDPAQVRDLHLVYRSPKLNDEQARATIAEHIAAIGPVLVIVDPLYLAAAGSDGASLYGMATMLEKVQQLATDAGAALIVVHHWNQTGRGSGFARMSGAGPEEWGRVLWSASVEERGQSVHPDGSLVRLTIHVRGGEVADAAFTMTREVWVDDPDDLNSAMHYVATRGELVAGDATGKKLNAQERCMAVLQDHDGEWMDKVAVQDADADWSKTVPDYQPMQMDTVGKALAKLADAGKAQRSGQGTVGYRYRWTA